MTTILRDALRQSRREPIPALIITLTMAIGIAAATAIFTVARGVLLRPLPYRSAADLVVIQEYQPGRSRDEAAVAYANVDRYREARLLSDVTAFGYGEFVLSGDADAERVIGAAVDGDLFVTLGVTPLIGRGIERAEVGANPAHVVVLAHELWQRRFGGDRLLVGRAITIDGAPYTVVGIAPEAFEFPRNPAMDRDIELWLPGRFPPPTSRRGARDLTVIARIRPDADHGQAETEIEAIAQRAERDDPAINKGWRARDVELRELIVGRVRPPIIMLSVCVGMLLLVGCANASATMTARIVMRRQSFGMRLALGASIAHVVGMVVAEVISLAFAATVIAMPLSAVVRGALVRVAPVAIPRQHLIVLDGVALVFMLGVALVSAVVAALGPITWLRRNDLRRLLAETTAAAPRSRDRTLAVFVIAQACLATTLLVLALTLYSTFVEINRVDPGFDADNVWTATIPLRGVRYRDGASRSRLTTTFLESVRAIPGVEHAAFASLMPLSGGLMTGSYRMLNGGSDTANTAAQRAVSADFFRTLGIRMIDGRPILQTDNASAVRVVVVNQAFAKQALGSRPAVGAIVMATPPGSDSAEAFQIVGVAADAKEKDLLGAGSPIIYFSDAQVSFPHAVLAVRSTGAPPLNAIRAALRALDPSLALDAVGPLTTRVRSTYGIPLFLLNVLSVFAMSTLALIAVGVYGSVSYVVGANIRGVAIRLALGASPIAIAVRLLRRTSLWAATGSAIGLAVSIALARTIHVLSMSVNLAVAIVAATMVSFVTLSATWPSARRASRIDPIALLRSW